MKTEIEVKFTDIDIDNMRERLKQANARCVVPMRDIVRTLYEPEHLKKRNAFIRVRHEGDKTTLTYKQFNERSLTGAKEVEIEADLEESVRATAAQLGFYWNDAVFGSVDAIYELTFPGKTNRGVIDVAEVRFGLPVPSQFMPHTMSTRG